MTPEERKEIVALYETRFEEKGYDISTVGWSSQEQQVLRFEMLLRGLDLKGKTILDVGCGFGDIIPFIQTVTKNDFKYIGTDISTALVDHGREKFGSDQCQFISGDILELTDLPTADIVLLSGALNYRIQDNVAHARAMISKMYELCTESVSVNMLTRYVDFEAEINFHHSPEDILTFAKSLSRWVNIYHDYPLYEFTLQIHRQTQQGI
ncbi:MAG: class I SAM-dependent methyltransferase [Rhodospirillales bacterium]|nr:class I SAM-dependent methyltransferase [Rhodospirillales bacterium]